MKQQGNHSNGIMTSKQENPLIVFIHNVVNIVPVGYRGVGVEVAVPVDVFVVVVVGDDATGATTVTDGKLLPDPLGFDRLSKDSYWERNRCD